MISISCPGCGKPGNLPLDRLNSRLTCKKCGAIFYMDNSGHMMLGDPNAPKKGRRKRAQAQRSEPIDLDFGRMIRDIPKPVRLGVPIVLAAGLLVYAAAWLIGSMGAPDDVLGRSRYIGELFADNALEEIRALAAPGTAEDLDKWYGVVRPKLNYEGPRSASGDVSITPSVYEDNGASAQSFAAILDADAPPPSVTADADAEAPGNSVTLDLSWTKKDGRWLLDGTSMYQRAIAPPRPGRGGRR